MHVRACVCVCVFVVLVEYYAYIVVWRYVVVHVRMCTCVPGVEDRGGILVCVGACLHECVY